MRDYIYSPAGPKELQSSLPRKCVEYIGSTQAGCGSDYSKGRRYLKRTLNCSGRAIKRTVNVCCKVLDEFETYGLDAYFYHIDKYVDIIMEIIRFVKQHSDDSKKIDLLGKIPSNDQEYIDLLFYHRISQLQWVAKVNYCDQAEGATEILSKIPK